MGVAAFDWIRWQLSRGLGGRLHWNTHFSGYGDKTQPYWQQFIAFSDTLSGDISQCQEALKAACQTFELFSELLDQALPQHYTLAS